MPTISSVIENFIKDLIRKSDENFIEIQRNDLAKYFNCAPSQINYVLMTRFTLKQGYAIESQRGGGGYIKIRELILTQNPTVYHIITKEMGDSLSQQQGHRIIGSLLDKEQISKNQARIMRAAIEDATLIASTDRKNQLRANILKNMLSILLEED